VLAGARAEAADGLASVRAALETAVATIAAQLDPLRASVEYANATLDTVKQATETRVLPVLERHDAALARQGKWRRALGDLASRLRSRAARTSQAPRPGD